MARSAPTISNADLRRFLEETQAAVDLRLSDWAGRVREERGDDRVAQAIAYSLSTPGKRMRPALVIAAYRAVGGEADPSELAAAVEAVHTYSLVHDDLPCMDNDDLRRGLPTVHTKFDVPTATEAGYRMVELSAVMLRSGCRGIGVDDTTANAIARELYHAAGAEGMIGGQVLDLEAEGRQVTYDELLQIHRMKTGALIAASAAIGALAGGAPTDTVAAVREFGAAIGLAFQIVDDVLDATQPSSRLGKTAGKDAAQHKASFVAYLGVDGATEAAHATVDRAVDRLREYRLDSTLLVDLAWFVVNRES
jgi:geranylgeranyl pyrophosphate synthase